MDATNQQMIAVLNRLVRICNASESGFNLAAESVKNRGLLVIFRGYAQERGRFGDELGALVRERGGEPAEGSGALAALHRGWITIKAAMTIGQLQTEKVILDEVSRGERAARDAYANALRQTLPGDIRSIVEAQQAAIEAVGERVEQMRGVDGRRLVVRLFNSADEADMAEDELVQAGFARDVMERVPLSEAVRNYRSQTEDRTTLESAAAGATLGGVLGVLIGFIAGISALVAPVGPLADMTPFQSTAVTVLLGLAIGLFFGALFGTVIGTGIVQEDEFRYADTLKQGSLLLSVHAGAAQADEAATITKGVNARRWRAAASA
jgi:uncharacterized protein (TIGR02284 family)